MIKAICYVSNKSNNLDDIDLQLLFSQVIEKNNLLNITGILIYKNDHFFQIMEGEEDNIKEVYKKIAEDARHVRMIKLLDKEIENRLFADYESGSFSIVNSFSKLKKLTIYFNWLKLAGLIEVDEINQLATNFINYNK